ncbi:nucleotidyltransferase family protein [Leptospira adleri]|uniref:Polymerase beta nucleotidyltransferase domain-containing protein n=1 Tax=Leptospira adleri TaxID=2023186 RepID=A0ABX4NRU0_9LEPT|nr:nucleotidyltransferase domain-containing protein [Leptospira adleri]PJZ59555.1 hypothetical protein CH376_23075 [Leptospira adleri]
MSSSIQTIADFQQFITTSKLLSKYHLERVGIFGSFARKDSNFQDIDILVDQDIDYKSALLFKAELEKNIERKIDLVLSKYANPIILHRAQKEMVYVKE